MSVQLCMRPDCHKATVGYIPMPTGDKCIFVNGEPAPTNEKLKDLHVCERHFREAQGNLLLVVRYGENPSGANLRHDKLISAKHVRLFGKENRTDKHGRWLPEFTRAA